jgi:hypothetical protein
MPNSSKWGLAIKPAGGLLTVSALARSDSSTGYSIILEAEIDLLLEIAVTEFGGDH